MLILFVFPYLFIFFFRRLAAIPYIEFTFLYSKNPKPPMAVSMRST